ncbi:7TM diverse intracellular signaling domain-containing protein [Aquabacterium sp.]|uniref:sensor domain-containing diguanylate cyclase n=1 Tax=Aquabacterium sp. TaxID=1872578 RepID=UPI0035AE3189
MDHLFALMRWMARRPGCRWARAVLVCSLLGLFGASPAWASDAAPAVELGPASLGRLLGRQMQVLEDPTGQLTLQQVLARPERFEPSTREVPNFGFTHSVYWFHLRLANRASGEDNWLLEAQYPMIDRFTFHTVLDGRVLGSTEGGRALPFNQRAIKHRNVVYPIDVAKGQAVDVYIRVQTRSSLQLPLALWTPHAFMARDHEEQLAFGLYYGVLAAMLLYNLMIYLSIRETSYFYYLHYIAGYIAFQMSLNGLAYEYLWPDSPRWGAAAVPILICVALIGMVNFSRTFLNLPQHLPRVAVGMRGAVYGLGAIAALALVAPYGLVIKLAVIGALLSAVAIFAVGTVCLARGVKQARYFMLAWTVLLAGIALYVLKTVNLVPSMMLTEYALQIGSALEAVLLSFALAQRMTILKEENARIQAEATHKLEQRVRQRTRQLDEALKNLSTANTALQAMNLMDGLTGIKNRKHFDNQLSSEIKRSSRGELSLSLLLIDIDHFKHVNDEHGHLAGDACLRAVAGAIRACLNRPSDEVARYGGEEFAVVLPHTDANGVTVLAERIRGAVEAMRFEFEGRHIPLTVSVGCCSAVPTRSCPSETLIAAADAALYRAKHEGRNRVCAAPLGGPRPAAGADAVEAAPCA